MTPKKTQRSARAMQKFYRSAKPGLREPRALPAREWLASVAGSFRAVDREDFSGEELVSAHLGLTRFHRCDFSGTDLRQADLSRSTFVRSDFSGADLTGADLQATTFWHCDFSGAALDSDAMATGAFDQCTGLPHD